MKLATCHQYVIVACKAEYLNISFLHQGHNNHESKDLCPLHKHLKNKYTSLSNQIKHLNRQKTFQYCSYACLHTFKHTMVNKATSHPYHDKGFHEMKLLDQHNSIVDVDDRAPQYQGHSPKSDKQNPKW